MIDLKKPRTGFVMECTAHRGYTVCWHWQEFGLLTPFDLCKKYRGEPRFLFLKEGGAKK